MNYYTEEFDKELKKMDIYQRYPQLLPFIGTDYSNRVKKVLFIGESHYLPDKHSFTEKTVEDWYEKTHKDLTNEERRYTKTRENVSIGSNKAHVIYRNIEKAIQESGFNPPQAENMFRYCGFYNYFLRPSFTNGETIKSNYLDKCIAFITLQSLKSILKFDVAIFTSKKAYNDFNWMHENMYPGFDIKPFAVPHPGTKWWNTKSKEYAIEKNGASLTGKEKLIEIIKVNKLFE